MDCSKTNVLFFLFRNLVTLGVVRVCVFYMCFGLCVVGLLATDYSFVIKSRGETKVGIILLWLNATNTKQLVPPPLDIGVLVLWVLQHCSNIAIL